ncbi:CocE/NonD family hydrolase [Nonomuraea insulae]|uniref:CocE/NonD family hydrolase n=1 Tax=Nonomuraea insulae TaxID=1616787 RepID=A0ABW1CL31_9ACTN
MMYGRILAALSTALTVPLAPHTPADPFFSYDRPATYEVRTERVQVPLRDGGHLACDLHRPAADGRFPVIVYDYTAYDQLESLGRAAAYFVERGYNAAVCNARGSGDSPGHLDPFSAQEQRDNYDLIEWLAARPWSTDLGGSRRGTRPVPASSGPAWRTSGPACSSPPRTAPAARPSTSTCPCAQNVPQV